MNPADVIVALLQGLLRMVAPLWKAKALFTVLRQTDPDDALDIVAEGTDDTALLAQAILRSRARRQATGPQQLQTFSSEERLSPIAPETE